MVLKDLYSCQKLHHSFVETRERLADDNLCEISVCVSPTQAKKYAIKPVIPETYHQPDALYSFEIILVHNFEYECGTVLYSAMKLTQFFDIS